MINQRRLRFGARAGFLRSRTSNGFARGAPLISRFGSWPAIRAQMHFEILDPHRCELLAFGWLRHGRFI
jgi:hypothetical protein